ncbi:MAG: hypothetical protein CHACPFDD_00044 [Phycisphaerae bacterium]|nr:hypothetical protein [Phycisphaerae bacterium]
MRANLSAPAISARRRARWLRVALLVTPSGYLFQTIGCLDPSDPSYQYQFANGLRSIVVQIFGAALQAIG